MNYKRRWIYGIIIFILIVFARIPVMEYFYDLRTERQIQTLKPEVREKARAFISKAKAQGIKLLVADAYRSIEEQNKLYAKGRSQPGSIVTYAKGGESSHNKGTAIDVYPIYFGFAYMNNQDWGKIATIGKSVGFSWGGDWKTFKDNPHFEVNRNSEQ